MTDRSTMTGQGMPRKAAPEGDATAPDAPSDQALSGQRERRQKLGVTLLGVAANLLLVAGKLLVGVIAQSYALIADALHSASDIISDVIVILAIRVGNKGPDQDHPYGHARFETLATAAVGLLLIALGLYVAVDAGLRLLTPEALPTPGALALIAAAVSVLIKEALYQVTQRVARRWNSNLLKANAWHHRSDALSSLVALAGIGGAILGLPMLDAVGAIIIALMLIKIGWDCTWPSLQELVDTGLDKAELRGLEEQIHSVPEVRGLGALRTRRFGNYVMVDVEIRVDPMLSVSEGHRIGEAVRRRLEKRIEAVNDVTVHVEPHEPRPDHALEALPGRAALVDDLRARIQGLPGHNRVRKLTLHYIDGKIEVEILLPKDVVVCLAELADVQKAYASAAEDLPHIRRVQVRFT